jgi:hypothetical protein
MKTVTIPCNISCPTCRRTGRFNGKLCPLCRGTGTVPDVSQPNAPEYIDPAEELTQVDPFAPTEHPSEGRAEIRRSMRWAVQAVRVLGAL